MDHILDPILRDISLQAAHFWRTDRDAFHLVAHKWSEELLERIGTTGCLALIVSYMESKFCCSEESIERYRSLPPMELARNAVTSLLFKGLPENRSPLLPHPIFTA